MMAATHRLGGLAAGVAMAGLLQADLYETGIVVAGAVLGSLLPDIDNPHSSISRRWQLTSFFITLGQGIIRLFSKLLPRKQAGYIKSMIGHRGITHSLMAVCLLPVPVILLGRASGYLNAGIYGAVGIAAGILSHILFDMLAGGAPLFMPFTTKRIVIAKIKTGGLLEWIFRGFLIVIFLYFGMEGIAWQELLQV